MKKRDVLRVPALAEIEQIARIGIVKLVAHLGRVGIGCQAVEGEAAATRGMQLVERRLDIVSPFRVRTFQTNIEYSTRDTIVRLPIQARGTDEVCVRSAVEASCAGACHF